MQNKFSLLLLAVLMTSSAAADDARNSVFGDQNPWRSSVVDSGYHDDTEIGMSSEDETQGPSKAEIVKFLAKKLARSIEKTALLEQEIRCVERSDEADDSLSRCYEVARYKRQQMKQKYGLNRPSQRRSRQGAGVMPNFDSMRMGMMPTPW